MNRGPKLSLLACLLLTCTALTDGLAESVAPASYYNKISQRFADVFPEEHLEYNKLDDSISMLAWTNYIQGANGLDPDHTYFLESDIERFEAEKKLLDDHLIEGELEFAYDVFETYKQRLRDRYAYIQKLLDGKFDLTRKETYKVKRRQEPFPSDKKQWDAIWRKKIKNEYVRHVVADELDTGSKDSKPDKENKSSLLEDLPPSEAILKHYKNMMTIIEDSDSEWVLQKYLTACANAYDPHSSYLSPSALANFDIEMKLSLEGIGALLQPEDGTAMIVKLIPGGPASRDNSENRLKPGDKIIAVAQGDEPAVDIRHWPLDKIVELIRGPKGTDVVLTIIPKADPTGTRTKTVRITRDEVKLEAQEAKWHTMNASGTEGAKRKFGVVSLQAFYANMYTTDVNDPKFKSSARDVQALIETNSGQVEGILLDLRNNGGGSLLEAIRMTGLFIKTGPVVQVKERFRRVLKDADPAVAYSGPLVVLVNRLSASASEIVTGALQDYGRAVIVGDSKTHGKGTVQTILKLGDDASMGSVKITTAGYYRISGDSTQLSGVTPDIVLSSPFDHNEWSEENLPNAIRLKPVHRANYMQSAQLEPVITKLRKNSNTRTAQNKDYKTYLELLGRIHKMYDIKEMPLDLESRKEMAQSEKEIYEIQEKLIEDVNMTTNNTFQSDIVLHEALNILADLSSLWKKAKQAPPPPPPPPQTMFEIIQEWLESL